MANTNDGEEETKEYIDKIRANKASVEKHQSPVIKESADPLVTEESGIGKNQENEET